MSYGLDVFISRKGSYCLWASFIIMVIRQSGLPVASIWGGQTLLTDSQRGSGNELESLLLPGHHKLFSDHRKCLPGFAAMPC